MGSRRNTVGRSLNVEDSIYRSMVDYFKHYRCIGEGQVLYASHSSAILVLASRILICSNLRPESLLRLHATQIQILHDSKLFARDLEGITFVQHMRAHAYRNKAAGEFGCAESMGVCDPPGAITVITNREGTIAVDY
jgi:hypothetical protein